MTKNIDSFRGEYRFLSNFYSSPFVITGQRYKTVEHYYQSQKCLNRNDFIQVVNSRTPAEAKRLVKLVEITPFWDDIKLHVMAVGLIHKFKDEKLMSMLHSTGNSNLIEGNVWHDNYWGICNCPRCKNIEGQNYLGKMLMKIRRM